MEMKSLADEQWREYEWVDPATSMLRVYKINQPAALWVGNTTHRVQDATGVVHCVPSVGHLGCVLRWMPRDLSKPVQF